MLASLDPTTLRQIGRYPVRRYLASGGMSWVFEVEDTVLGVTRALKLLKPEAAQGQELSRFEKEARIIARFNHPNLFTVYDFGKDETTGCFYYTMNLVEGLTFGEVEVSPSHDPDATRQSLRSFSVHEACGYFVQVLDALVRLHAEGIVHRDIKPRNIFLQCDRTGEIRPMLGDLGVARVEGDSELTRAGYTVGTPLYMSPEQVRGSVGVGPVSDVFSFGLTMHRVLTGRSVYDELEDVDSSSVSHVLAYLGGLSMNGDEFDFRFPATVPEPLRRVIRRACRMDPNERYRDAQAMRAALEDALAARFDGRDAGASRSRHAALVAGIVLGLALAGTTGFYVWSERGSSAERALATERIAGARGLGAQATALVEHLDQATDLPAQFADESREALAGADRALASADRSLSANDFAAADGGQRLAREGYADLCERIASEWLLPRSRAAAMTARSKRPALDSAVAADPTRWQELARQADSYEVPAALEGCAGADGLAARAEEGDRLVTALARFETSMAADAAAFSQREQEKAQRKKQPPEKSAKTASAPKTPSAPPVVAATTAIVRVDPAPLPPPSDEQLVKAAITRWCSAANRGELSQMNRVQMGESLRAAFDKRAVGFDEQRCRIRSLEIEGEAYVASVPIEQIRREGDMSNVMRQFVSRIHVVRDANGWRIDRIDGTP